MTTQTLDTSLPGLFNNTAIQYVFFFLAIYLFAYFGLQLVFANSSDNGLLRLVRILDVIVFVFIVIYLVIAYGNKNMDELKHKLSENIHDFRIFADNPYSIFTENMHIHTCAVLRGWCINDLHRSRPGQEAEYKE